MHAGAGARPGSDRPPTNWAAGPRTAAPTQRLDYLLVRDTTEVLDAFVPEPDSSGSRFARAYETKHGHAPSLFAANAYEAVKTLAETARLSAEAGRPLTGGGRLRQALLARRTFPSVYGGELRVRDDGTIEHPLALFTVAQGKATFVRYVTPAGRPVVDGRQDGDGDGAVRPTP